MNKSEIVFLDDPDSRWTEFKLTGGGPDLMEATNRGSKDEGGKSVGCNIQLPVEQQPNPYPDKLVNIKLFFERKILLVKYCVAFVVMPAGFGTMDEFFEALTLIRTRKIHNFPVIIRKYCPASPT